MFTVGCCSLLHSWVSVVIPYDNPWSGVGVEFGVARREPGVAGRGCDAAGSASLGLVHFRVSHTLSGTSVRRVGDAFASEQPARCSVAVASCNLYRCPDYISSEALHQGHSLGWLPDAYSHREGSWSAREPLGHRASVWFWFSRLSACVLLVRGFHPY
jgi:hypothetical protein